MQCFLNFWGVALYGKRQQRAAGWLGMALLVFYYGLSSCCLRVPDVMPGYLGWLNRLPASPRQ